MADLIAHTAFASGLIRSPRFFRFRSVLYVGTVLPDILSRPVYILMPQLYPYTVAIHTPVFMAALSLFLCQFFHANLRAAILKYLWVGIALHFILDLFQKHTFPDYFWFFPFSWKSFEIGLYWAEDLFALIPVWIAIIVYGEFAARKANKKQQSCVTAHLG
jgi:hypothetical protein